MTKAIIFDCFGVLYPASYGIFFQKHKDLFAKDLTAWDRLNIKIDLGEITRAELFSRTEEVTGMPANEIQNEIDSILLPDQELIAFIKQLKAKYKIGLLSNAGEEEIAILYRDKIDSVFYAKVVSYAVKMVKPDPNIFLACAERLDAQPTECVFLDDSPANIAAAQKLGMKAILYPVFGQIPEELQEYFVNFIIDVQ